MLELALPAVVTATEALNHARYPSIKGLLKKDEVEIGNLTAADLSVDPARIGMKGSPTQVRQVRPVVPPKKKISASKERRRKKRQISSSRLCRN